jgi:glucosamine--fructose-6-phosphate aminotransferase (isomerizing)
MNETHRDSPASPFADAVWSGPTPEQLLAALAADGPDEMGRDLAGSAEAVEATLAEVVRLRPELDGLLETRSGAVLVGTGMSLAVAEAAAPAWLASRRIAGGEASLLVRESTSAVLGAADGRVWRPDELVVMVSKSGASPETVAAARDARTAGCAVVAVTADAGSPLASLATLVVPTPTGEEGGAGTRSAAAALAALHAIPVAGWAEAAVAAEVAARIRAAIYSWPAIAPIGLSLAKAAHTWVVGFGPGAGLAQAAGILWHEKVRRPAVALSVSEFRHGPIEAVQPGDAVIVIDPDLPHAGRARYLEMLRIELDRLGATCVWVSPTPPHGVIGIELAPGGPTVSPILPSPAMALEALLRLQQLARSTAHAAGTYRDGFKVLRTIVQPATRL